MDGDRYERRFVKLLVATPHWWAQRAAASGSATEADLPDMTFAHDGVAFAGEMKSRDGVAYLKPEEVDALIRYAGAYGMRPVVILRQKGDPTYYVFNPNDMDHTESGNYIARPGTHAAEIAEPETGSEGVEPRLLSGSDLGAATAGQITTPLTDPITLPEGSA